jgi:hypothetical protein
MNEKRMKTSVNTGELSSPPAQGACWGVKVRAEHGCGSEKPALGVEKWLEMPREESPAGALRALIMEETFRYSGLGLPLTGSCCGEL